MADVNGRIISDAVPANARGFVAAQSWLALAYADAAGAPWCGMIGGRPGFASVIDDGVGIRLLRPTAAWCRDAFAVGGDLGLLFIELATRRRLRVNGAVAVAGADADADADAIEVRVHEAYPNCPKYIQRRVAVPTPATRTVDGADSDGDHGGPVRTDGLDAAALALLAVADTAFLGSGAPGHGRDASHRGGPPGFIAARGPDLLAMPDYDGNGMFNTFGNLAIDARLSLAVPDFAGGRQLLASGTGAVRWQGPDGLPGGRTLEIALRAWRWAPLPGAGWTPPEPSPFTPGMAIA